MTALADKLTARIAYWHASRTHRRFQHTLADVDAAQNAALRRALRLVARGRFGREHRLDRVRSLDDLRRATPLRDYEGFRPYIEQTATGDTNALFSPGVAIRMFATSSGTTARRKLVPVTQPFIDDYRRGWNTFGLKMLADHPDAILRSILQISGRDDEAYAASGAPIGAITGLLSKTQKRIVRRYYVGRPTIARVSDPALRYYILMRMAATRDVAFAITANPATLIRLAQTADEQAEQLIRDVHDGVLGAQLAIDDDVRRELTPLLRPEPTRGRELDRLRASAGILRPRDMWRISFVACWTGGSMGHYLERVADWWGPAPVRDVGLLASEGRVSLPMEDNTPAGVLDITAGCFEFIPIEQFDAEAPETLGPRELEIGREYAVVLTNTTGLVRYRLDDVVRMVGWRQQTPIVEFLYRGGRVASVAGEKVTENQFVEAVKSATRELGISEFDFVAAPVWDEPPHYRLSCVVDSPDGLAEVIDRALCAQNEEYASRRKSLRLNPLEIRRVPAASIAAMDHALLTTRGSTSEQYKRPCLFSTPGEDDRLLSVHFNR